MASMETTIGGETYRVVLVNVPRPVVWVQVRKVCAKSEDHWAMLSHRQHKAEARVRSRFQKEIWAHLNQPTTTGA